MEVDSNQVRLFEPINLTLGPWFAVSKSGITTYAPDCGLKLELEGVTIRHHRHHIVRVHSLNLCTLPNAIRISRIQTTIGRIQLDIDRLESSSSPPKQLILSGIDARCGRYLPLHLSTRKAHYDGEHVILRDSTLRFHNLPIGWFPHLKVSETGHSGLLPPTLSLRRDEFRVGLPFYWLIAPNQALTLTPGYHHHSEPALHIYGNGLYEWRADVNNTGRIRTMLQPDSASISGAGKARTRHWRINLYGNTAFSPAALTMDPQLNASALTGYSRGGVTVNRLDESLHVGLRVERVHTDTDPDNSTLFALSQSSQFASIRHTFDWGQIALYNRSITQWEPDYRWLSSTALALDLEQRWWLFRLQNRAQARLQHDATAPLFQQGVLNHGVPVLNEELTIESLWRRRFDDFTHIIGLIADGELNYRLSDEPNELDTQTPPNGQRNARASVGIRSMTYQKTGMTSVSANLVHLSQSEVLKDQFFETTADAKYQSARLRLHYAHERSILVNGTFDFTRHSSFRATYFERSEHFAPLDLLDPLVYTSAPTVGYYLNTQTQNLEFTGAAWTTPEHTTFQAGAVRLSHLARCECVKWTTEAKYLRHRQNFWLTTGVEFVIDDSRTNALEQRTNPINSSVK